MCKIKTAPLLLYLCGSTMVYFLYCCIPKECKDSSHRDTKKVSSRNREDNKKVKTAPR